ncbi:MAG TPA: hypothetical protein VLV31_01575 [Candidatus Acidoferrales bacterium]|nr:hypothetical protein [Candidatus Acidoferrales bacterium]
MKIRLIVPVVLLAVLVSIFTIHPALAQGGQTASSTVVLNHLNVQLAYPSQVLPGESVTVNLTAQAKDNFVLSSLTMQVYSADTDNLHQLLSTIVASNTIMLSGQQINKQIQVNVPSSASRTSLIAQLSETVGTTGSTSYPFNPYAYPYSYGNGYWYQYGAYPTYPYYYYGYSYSPTTYYPIYPASNYNIQGGSDNGIAPLSYILATTPEFVTAQSQNQQLLNQNQQLQQEIQQLQNSTAQKDNTISNLNNQLSSAQGTTIVAEIVAVILAIALVAVAAIHFKSTKATTKESPTKTEGKTA